MDIVKMINSNNFFEMKGDRVMEDNKFEKWNKLFNAEKMNEECKTAYQELPEGVYEVGIECMELKETRRDAKPMLSIMFDIIEGKYRGRKIFYNQVLTNPTQIQMANRMLSSIGVIPFNEVCFEDFSQYDALITKIYQLSQENYYQVKHTINYSGYWKNEILRKCPYEFQKLFKK